jgi:MFS family permease
MVLLFAINLFNYVDRLVITGLLEPIRRDLLLTDTQLGQIALAFLATYSIFPLLVGWIADRTARVRLIVAATGIFSVATGLAALTRGVASLAVTRAVVGIGETTYMTTGPSLIADLYPANRRGAAMSFFYAACPIGAAVGVVLGGVIAAGYGWRIACLAVSAPGIVLAFIVSRFSEPERGSFDPLESAARPPLSRALRQLAANRPFILLVIAFIAQIFSYNAVEFWLPTLLQRDKALPLVSANTTFGTVVAVAGFVGPLLGGFLGNLLASRNSLGYYWICAISMIVSVVPVLGFAALTRGTLVFGTVFLEVLLGNMSIGLVMALLVSVVVPGLRATATAIMLTAVHVLGDGISVPLIGYISTALQEGRLLYLMKVGTLIRVPETHTLSLALVCVVVPSAVVAGILYLVAMRSQPGALTDT